MEKRQSKKKVYGHGEGRHTGDSHDDGGRCRGQEEMGMYDPLWQLLMGEKKINTFTFTLIHINDTLHLQYNTNVMY